jgi:hypothetical protein
MIDVHVPTPSTLGPVPTSSTEVHPAPILWLESISDLVLDVGSSAAGGINYISRSTLHKINYINRNTLYHHILHQALLLIHQLHGHRLVYREVYTNEKFIHMALLSMVFLLHLVNQII